MTDIHIRHCRIQARAAPGSGLIWADAGAGREFAQRVQVLVLSMLDQMLAPHLAALPLAGIPKALVLELTLDAADLSGAAPLARRHLRDHVREAIAVALTRAPAADPEPVDASGRAAADADAEYGALATATGPLPMAPARLLDLLLGWHEDRQLEYRLALLSDETVIALIEAIRAELAARRGAVRGTAGEDPAPRTSHGALPATGSPGLRRALHELVAAASDTAQYVAGSSAAARLERALAAAMCVVQAFEGPLLVPGPPGDESRARETRGTGRVRAARRKARTSDSPEVTSPAKTPQKPRSVPDAPSATASPRSAPSPATHRGAPRRTPLSEGRYAIESALPFLALQPLSRHGVLSAMSAMSDRGESDAIAALAYALALRTQLPSAANGWSAPQLQDAARLAGLDAPIDGTGLVAAARGAGAVCEMAAGSVAATLIAGHRAGLPLLLLGDAGRLTVFESEGFYPLCRLDAARIAEAFAGLDEAFFLAEPDSALLTMIDAAGLATAASGAPVRGEAWRPVAAKGWKGMTNMAPARFAAIAPRLAGTARAARRAAEVWRGLTVERPLFPETASTADALNFDRTVSLLAGFALADIAWTLFGRNPAAWAEPDPLLTIERFADLSATLEVNPEGITVSLPLGRRFTDLRDAGLLDTIRDVPWWPGRTISFSCG